MKTDVLIVGGGPSGLAAAYEVASRGYTVTIVEEAWKLGGQMKQQTQVIDDMPAPWAGLRGFQVVDALVERLKEYPIEYLLSHEVIGLYADGSVGVSDGKKLLKINPSSIIVATGAAESSLAFSGWTLPGVMTIGAAQIFINRERVYPGKTALIIGSSDMALEITRQMHDVGIHIVGIVEAAEKLLAKDDKTICSFHETGIPVLLQAKVIAATGRDRVESVIESSGIEADAEINIPVDLVCIDGGRQPILELLTILHCPLQYRKELGGWVPCYRSTFESHSRGIFIAGQAAGITCQAGVFLTGAIAGIGIVDYLEKETTAEREITRQAYWDELKQIEGIHLPTVWLERLAHMKDCLTSNFPKQGGYILDQSTVICRCEEITVGDVENALAQGAETFDDVKRLTRVGMGICQGKTCGRIISELIAISKNKAIADIPVSRLRMPLRPILMGVLARSDSDSSTLYDLLEDAINEERQGN